MRASMMKGAVLLALLGTCTSCRAAAVVGLDSQSQLVVTRVGAKVDVTLGNVGPAIYESPPAVSPIGVVTYLGVEVVPPFNPGGPTQRFHFVATAPGRAIVTFRRTLNGAVVAVVTDTLEVQ